MKNKIGVLVISIVFITNMCTCFHYSIQAKETDITWNCTMHISETGGKMDNAVFGEAPNAGNGPPADKYDVVKPPTPLTPYLRVWFDDNLPSPYTLLWEDYRCFPDTSKIWNLTVQWIPSDYSTSTMVTIVWNSADIDASEYSSVHLYTKSGAFLVDMLMDESYTFTAPANIPQIYQIICSRTNSPPEAPSVPSGEITGFHGMSYIYSTSGTDPDGDDLYYQFDWGNSILSSWLGPYHNGETIHAAYNWGIPGSYQVKAHTKDIYNAQSSWSLVLSVEMMNRAPIQPKSPFPQNGTSKIQITPILTWIGTDPDGDIITYDVFFGTTNPPPKIVNNQSSSSFHPGTLSYKTTYYWKILSWDSFGGRSRNDVWSFTTISSEGSTPEPPNGDTNQTNKPPVANASLSEHTGFVGTLLLFNGSRSYDPDGFLTKWLWDFGDGTNASGEKTIHTYQTLGLYTVTLTVTDNKGATGKDTLTVEIGTANWPPTKPVLNGTRIGTKNTSYTYHVFATDADNDFLQYTINWGDGTQNTSSYLPNGTSWSMSHSWNHGGKYRIIVTATDNTTYTEQTDVEIFIDVSFVSTLGFLFDIDNDGQFDSFFINKTGSITKVQRITNGSYCLDTDNDGRWNFLYNPSSGALTSYSSSVTTIENQWFFVLIIAIAVIIIACIVYLYKKNYF